jgi:hypothetical protein
MPTIVSTTIQAGGASTQIVVLAYQGLIGRKNDRTGAVWGIIYVTIEKDYVPLGIVE